jgi:hypothetical protein
MNKPQKILIFYKNAQNQQCAAGENDGEIVRPFAKKSPAEHIVCGRFLSGKSTVPLCLHGIESLGELALLVCGAVLVDDALRSGNIDLLAGNLVQFLRGGHIIGSDCSAVLLDIGLQRGLEHLVLQGLCFGDTHALLRGLDIRHDSFLLIE